MNISEADRRLIAVLRANARMTVADIARELKLSRTTVKGRIEQLENRGVIEGYTVRIADRHERNLLHAHISLVVSPKATAHVVASLRGMASVRRLHAVGGEFDMIAVVEAESASRLDEVIDTIGALEGVERTTSAIILSTRFDR